MMVVFTNQSQEGAVAAIWMGKVWGSTISMLTGSVARTGLTAGQRKERNLSSNVHAIFAALDKDSELHRSQYQRLRDYTWYKDRDRIAESRLEHVETDSPQSQGSWKSYPQRGETNRRSVMPSES